MLDAAYFYESCNFNTDPDLEEPLDASDYFKTETEGRRYFLENTHFSKNIYHDRFYKEQIDHLAQTTEISLPWKSYPMTFLGNQGEIAYSVRDYSAPIYVFGLDDYIYEETSFHELFVAYTVNDGQLHSITLPAEEFDKTLPATKDLTVEQGKEYAVKILSAMGYSTEGYTFSVYDNGSTREDGRTVLQVTLEAERFGDAFVGYTVRFEHQESSSFSEQVTVIRHQPYIEGAPGVRDLIAQPDYEQKAVEDALTILKEDVIDKGYLDRLECKEVVARPRDDGAVSLLVCFEDKTGVAHEDHNDFSLTVLLIVKP